MEHNPNQTDLLSEDLTKPRIVVVIPAYNEERFIASVVLKARRYAHQVIVVDDGSRDETARLALEAGAKVVNHTHNQGKGTALHSGFTAAQAENPEVIVMLDADGQHCPEELGRVISPILAGEADIVVGSRYIQQTSNIPLHRVWGHHIFNLLTGAASGTHSSDSQSGFRAFSPSALGVFAFCSQWVFGGIRNAVYCPRAPPAPCRSPYHNTLYG
jgi:glycosyltransferase involved in cell wall biosynthesis